MPDIEQDFLIKVSADRVYDALTTPAILDQWWTLRSSGNAEKDAVYEFDFGPGYLWQAVVTDAVSGQRFALRFTAADDDWTDTTISFEVTSTGKFTLVSFKHGGWREANAHFRTTSHCWALYFRILRRYLEHGEILAYDKRLTA